MGAYPAANVAAYNANILWTVADPVSDAVYESIASQVAAEGIDITPAQIIFPHLKARHVVYSHTVAGIPKYTNGQVVDYGDCGQPTNNIPKGGLTALSDISTGLSAAVGSSGAAVAALGGAAGASAAGLGALNAVPIVGTIAAVALLPLELIFAHHAQAVSQEQGTLCGWGQAINQWFDAVDQAVQSGAMLPAQGIAALASMEAQYDTGVSGVSAPCSPGNTNAACDEKGIIHALVLLRTWMYNNLPMYNPAVAAPVVAPTPVAEAASSSPLSALFSGSASTGSGASLSLFGGGSSMMLILLAILAALFF